jgi:hypothetical protein
MGLTMRERHAIVRELAPRFRKSSKKQRSQILDEFVKLTGYTRCYAAFVLRTCGSKQVRMIGTRRVIFIPGHARTRGAPRQRLRGYGTASFVAALKRLWALSDGLCGKRLVAFIREILPHLENQGNVKFIDGTVRAQLLSVSAATVDRLLVRTKRQSQIKGRSTTRPGTLLKYHIPIRTFADWDNIQPGFCEADLVAHDGGSAFGDYSHSLNITDVASTWTETFAVKNKAQIHVFNGITTLRAQLPFPLLGLDSDNGSEFINAELARYCEEEHITFTRSRPYKKNDNCFVEQKNYSIVRRTVAYYRYDTPEQLALLNAIYATLRLYTNFFLPVMKLQEKVRSGSKVTRRYDAPLTPYKRLLDHPRIPQEIKDTLTAQYRTLDIVDLKQRLNHLQQQLFQSAINAGPPPPPPWPPHCAPYPGEDHPWRKKPETRRDAPDRRMDLKPSKDNASVDILKNIHHTPYQRGFKSPKS